MVVREDANMEKVVVSGVTHNKNEARITLKKVPDTPGIASRILSPVSEAGIIVDMIIQNTRSGNLTDLTFTVGKTDYKAAMEVSEKSSLYQRPLHPYTNALMKSVSIPDPRLAAAARQDRWLTGDMPSPYDRPKGCIFHNRCPYRVKRCEADVPALRRMENRDWVACHRAEELDLSI